MPRDFNWNVYDYSETAKRQREITAKDFDALYSQHSFNWGDPGTESGHTLDSTNNADFQATTGSDLAKFLRFEVEQTDNRADLQLSQDFRLQRRLNGGSWATCPTASGAGVYVYIIDHASITQGDDTTNRITGTGASVETFVTNNNAVCDTSADTGLTTFTADVTEHIEVLYSLQFVNAELSDGDEVDFRLVFGPSGSNTTDGALDGYTVTDATLHWGGIPTFDQDSYRFRDNVPDPTGHDAAFDAGDTAANTGVTLDTDTLYRVRTLVQQTNATARPAHPDLTTTFHWQFRKNGGTWTDCGADGTTAVAVVYDDCVGYVDSTGTDVQLIGAGTFVSGEAMDLGNPTGSVTFTADAATETEMELSFTIPSGQVSGSDTLELRLIYSADDEATPATAFTSYTRYPTITVSGGGPATAIKDTIGGTGIIPFAR